MNGQGRLQGAARVIPPRGRAGRLGVVVERRPRARRGLTYTSSAAGGAKCRGRVPGNPRYGGLAPCVRTPVSATHWLQASNPSDAWKWDFSSRICRP